MSNAHKLIPKEKLLEIYGKGFSMEDTDEGRTVDDHWELACKKLRALIGTEITSIPCDEYDIFSAKNEKENRLAESILKNAIYGEHNPNGFDGKSDTESDAKSCSFYTHSNRSSRYGFLCGTVVVAGNCGTW